MHNCFVASSFRIRDIFLQTLHHAFINIYNKISFKIFCIGLCCEYKKYFEQGRGELYVLQFLRREIPLCDGRSVSILSAQLSICWKLPVWRTALYEKQLKHAIHRTVFYRIFDKRNLRIHKRTANAQLVVELSFCILFGNDHLLIVISRGEVWTKQYAVQEFLARSKQAIYLRTSRIVFCF